MKRVLTITIACLLLAAAGFLAVSTFSPHNSGAAGTDDRDNGRNRGDGSDGRDRWRGATGTTGAQGATTAAPPAEPASTTTSTSDWILIAIEGLLVIGFIALGVRSGGIGLGLWGGVGTLVLVFGFGLDPGRAAVRRDADHHRGDLRRGRDGGCGRGRLHGP